MTGDKEKVVGVGESLLESNTYYFKNKVCVGGGEVQHILSCLLNMQLVMVRGETQR